MNAVNVSTDMFLPSRQQAFQCIWAEQDICAVLNAEKNPGRKRLYQKIKKRKHFG